MYTRSAPGRNKSTGLSPSTCPSQGAIAAAGGNAAGFARAGRSQLRQLAQRRGRHHRARRAEAGARRKSIARQRFQGVASRTLIQQRDKLQNVANSAAPGSEEQLDAQKAVAEKTKEIRDAENEDYLRQDEIKVASAGKNSAQILAIRQAEIAHEIQIYGQGSNQAIAAEERLAKAKEQAANRGAAAASKAAKDELADAEADAKYELQLLQQNAQEMTDTLNRELADKKIAMSQWLASSKDALADEAQDVQATYADELKTAGLTYKQIVDLKRDEVAKLKEIAHQITEDDDKGAKEAAAAWKAGADQIEGALNSQVDGLLKGAENFGAAFKNIMASMVEDAIKGLIKWGLEHLATMAMNTAATVGATAAQTGALATGVAAQKAINATTVSGDAGRAAAGAYAAVAGIPIIGPVLAPAAAAVAFGSVETFGSFDVGGYVNSSGLAMIHAGEEIRPADVTTPYRGGGGSVTHNHTWNITGGPNADPREIAREVARQWDSQPSLRPTY